MKSYTRIFLKYHIYIYKYIYIYIYYLYIFIYIYVLIYIYVYIYIIYIYIYIYIYIHISHIHPMSRVCLECYRPLPFYLVVSRAGILTYRAGLGCTIACHIVKRETWGQVFSCDFITKFYQTAFIN